MLKLKYFIQESWLLIVASFCFGLLIAVTDAALSQRVEQNKTNKLNNLTKNLLPQAETFQPLDAEFQVVVEAGKEQTTKVYKALSQTGQCVGWSFNASGTGFADKVELVVAVDEGFQKLAGFEVLSSNETPGFGDRIKSSYYRNQFVGAPADRLKLLKTGNPANIDSDIVAITGATVSSKAVVDIINNFMTQIRDQMQQKGLIGNAKQ